MESSVLLSLLFLLLLSLAFVVLVLKMLSQVQQQLTTQQTQFQQTLLQSQNSMQKVLSKALTLLSAKDALTYQAIQAMDSSPSSDSDESGPVFLSDEQEFEAWCRQQGLDPEVAEGVLNDSFLGNALADLTDAPRQFTTDD